MRFYGFVAMAFVTAFVAVSWASRGFPVGVPTLFLRSSVDASTSDGANTLRSETHTKPSTNGGDDDRDRLRAEVVRAVKTHALSPCNSNLQAESTKAVATYIKAILRQAGCSPKQPCGEDKLSKALEELRSPTQHHEADEAVQEAIALSPNEVFREVFGNGEGFPRGFISKANADMERAARSKPTHCTIAKTDRGPR